MEATPIQTRIVQWEKMTQEAPDAMSWFSLGNAYKDAARHADAAVALGKAIAFDPGMSRAYQLQAQCLIALGKNQEAIKVLTQGYTIAAERGDVMPQKAMESLLEKLGQPVPRVERKQVVALGTDQVMDRKTGRPGNRLPDVPMRGPLGKFIYENYSAETWREWIRTGTKVINELRLDFSNPAHQKIYDTHMLEWLGISEEELKQITQQEGGK